jgi:hypothetical protein
VKGRMRKANAQRAMYRTATKTQRQKKRKMNENLKGKIERRKDKL